MIGALVEAWAEFRVHRARVLLSLLGVAIAVFALTGVVGIGQIATQAQTEQMERGSGRPATLMVSPPFDPATGRTPTVAEMDAVFDQVVERYSVTYAGATSYQQAFIQLPYGVTDLQMRTVDPDFGVMHRVQLAEGAWFTERDELRLTPALILNEYLWDQLGRPSLASHPTVTLIGGASTTAVIVGVTPSPVTEQYGSAYLLNSAWEAAGLANASFGPPQKQYELWVPPELADTLSARISAELTTAFGEDWEMSPVQRNDYLAWGNQDPLAPLKLALAGIATLILLLGALSLVNIALVTVRQRIREIGIRRAFGATAPRVFLAVMLESVVATVVAGVLGVIAAVLVVRNDFILDYVAPGLSDVPPFPVEAAVLGLVAATAVGALAGLLPALIAVRVKVIDAIRY